MSDTPEVVGSAQEGPQRQRFNLLPIAGVICALAFGGWLVYRNFASEGDWSENALGEIFGADQPRSGNTIRPFLVEGENTDILLGLMRRPDMPLAPTYVVVIKKPVPAPSGSGSRTGGATIDPTFTVKSDVRLAYSSGKNLSVEYEQTRDPRNERFLIDGKMYSLEAGRVFLVDRTAQPHKVTQVGADIRELTPGQNWQRRQREEARKAVEQLRAQDPAVQAFLARD
jgi:hypothetical protein